MRTKKVIDLVESPQTFIDWLKEQPEDREFTITDVTSCPLKCYGRETNIPRVIDVLEDSFWVKGIFINKSYISPIWMRIFVNSMISKYLGTNHITAKQALSVMEDIDGY